ncbi:MAG: DUF2330 domain-containing protein [Rhodospirillales bacterium]|nr:DUF2330 domain-containing protein [Alphaproteobacteria bacterium]MCB1839860.1 DUF2330 domain-containing protein [Alphaproteobacteria bacterium]MCB9976474.1 DUF2330 domain-containing protein [Rhodospirillales bacterium]
MRTSHPLKFFGKASLCLSLLGAGLALGTLPAQAFCGFYVSKADSSLFNSASKVIVAHADERTVITMANDFQGDLDEFAIVIPVPEVLKKNQIHVAETRLVDHMDAYTAPRLVEYFDPDPCQPPMREMMAMSAMDSVGASAPAEMKKSAGSLGVTIEAEYTVGEYDIVLLSAKESQGLLTYLNQEGYKLPRGAEKILGSYIKQDLKFFLAKVNLEEQKSTGYTYLRPLQIAFESPKFVLPIRLGTLNAKGPQDLLLYTLTRNGRVETANYRTVKIPSNMNIPTYVKNGSEFGEFYKAMFDTAVKKENMKAVFLEYAWNMGWCDPCAADPIPNEDLLTLGAWWISQPPVTSNWQNRGIMPPQQAPQVFVTRMHVRYDADHFPEDLVLKETGDTENFQGRYVLQHPWTGAVNCTQGQEYLRSLPARFEQEAKTMAMLTGWDINDIRRKMKSNGQSPEPGPGPGPEPKPWWDDMWNKQ